MILRRLRRVHDKAVVASVKSKEGQSPSFVWGVDSICPLFVLPQGRMIEALEIRQLSNALLITRFHSDDYIKRKLANVGGRDSE